MNGRRVTTAGQYEADLSELGPRVARLQQETADAALVTNDRCTSCGQSSWSVVPWPIGEQPYCLGCTSTVLYPDAPAVAVLAWASRFLARAAARAGAATR